MTSATNPSLEDIITGAIPGMPRVVVHNPVLAFEQGSDFMQAWWDADRHQGTARHVTLPSVSSRRAEVPFGYGGLRGRAAIIERIHAAYKGS